MDGRREARIIGMAMVRGLVDVDSLREAARAHEIGLLDALMSHGSLDATDVEVLQSIPENPMVDMACEVDEGGVPGPDVDSTPSWDTGNLWLELPAPSSDASEEGKQVRVSLHLPYWRNYCDLCFIAEGGLGRIFRAFDPSLKRVVALKFLRRDDPELARRFVLEAQHQATVDHPNICKVFEVGDWKGQAYISMQFITGETLEAVAHRMSLREKIHTMQIVAEAIHAAHLHGLIHRDIKPANIMIEHSDEACPKPSILDFGLAKGLDASGLTLQGMVIGTLNYMAPEQALGQLERIGRRTDVYGLGATLYKLLTGRMVFQGAEGLESVRQTVEEDPVAPRRWVPDLPKDLEAVVLKCLEKDPERRYESAKALADDLRRFREGEPVDARPATLSYRAAKAANRHRRLVYVSMVAMGLVIAVGSWGFTTSLRARKVSALSAGFGAQAEQMATTLRMAYLLPRHDIRPHKATVRAHMQQIRQRIAEEGSLAEGPGAYALGQGHFALREYIEARVELERAWSKGYQNPQVALALGRTLGELYREGWKDLLRIGDLDQREAEKSRLQKQLRDPALSYLRLGASEHPERNTYLEGLLAYYEEHYSTAITKAREAFQREPTLYEAKLLEGNALMAMGLLLLDSDSDAFIRHLTDAGEPFSVALDIGRSDPALIAAEGTRRSELARYSYFFMANPKDQYQEIQASLDEVLAVDPEAAATYLAKAKLAEAYSVFLAEHGKDPFPTLDEGIAWCGEASNLAGGDLSVLKMLGELHRWKVVHQRSRGLDTTDAMKRTFDHWEEAINLQPGDAWTHQRLAEAYSIQSDIAFETGKNPQEHLTRGLRHIQEALRFADSTSTALSGANLHTGLGDWNRDHGRDPSLDYEQAQNYFRRAIRRSPGDGDLHTGLVDLTVRYASYLRQTGKPVDAILNEGLKAAEISVKLSPTFLRLLNQGDCLRFAAEVDLEKGRNPAENLKRAEEAFRQSERLNADGDYALYGCWGVLATVEGQAMLAQNRSPEVAWEKATEHLARAAGINPKAPELYVAMARLALVRSNWLRSQGRPFLDVIKEGVDASVQGFSLKPRQPELQALRGGLLRLQAGAAPTLKERNRLLALAAQDLRTAIQENPFLEREFGAELQRLSPSVQVPKAKA